ncbi:hypothetical protein VNO77_15479 [Canavalia gladiata]|uniref:Uncharacterized protein n=1 Tax=Canavalia gladiata TaxID=3824 RepID=A0AAN9LZK4_CANGL
MSQYIITGASSHCSVKTPLEHQSIFTIVKHHIDIEAQLSKRKENPLYSSKFSLYSLKGNSPRKKEPHQASSNLSKKLRNCGGDGTSLRFASCRTISQVHGYASCHYVVLSISTNWKEKDSPFTLADFALEQRLRYAGVVDHFPLFKCYPHAYCRLILQFIQRTQSFRPSVPLSSPFLVLRFYRIPTKRYMGVGNLHFSWIGRCLSYHSSRKLHVIDPHDPKLHIVIDLN